MPFPAPDLLIQNLHNSNLRLESWLDNLIPGQARASVETRVANPQQITGLLSELMRAGEWLRELPSEKDPHLEQELSDYRKNVERLRDLLPSIHAALLQEKARLEQERVRVESASEWARGSRQTL